MHDNVLLAMDEGELVEVLDLLALHRGLEGELEVSGHRADPPAALISVTLRALLGA